MNQQELPPRRVPYGDIPQNNRTIVRMVHGANEHQSTVRQASTCKCKRETLGKRLKEKTNSHMRRRTVGINRVFCLCHSALSRQNRCLSLCTSRFIFHAKIMSRFPRRVSSGFVLASVTFDIWSGWNIVRPARMKDQVREVHISRW